MPYIECHHCNKIIHNVSILKDITLNLDRNKIYGFIGHNGCGKTMLFKLLTGMISASGGEVFVNGERIDPAAPYPQKLGVMIENNGLWPYLSAYDNLAVLASIRKELNKEDIASILRRVGLDNTGKKIFAKFSLGMKQRLMLAQAIMEQPEWFWTNLQTPWIKTEFGCLSGLYWTRRNGVQPCSLQAIR